ncbi:MAG: ATP-binding protein [Oscillospiraceae bacterium]|nr:ATP-binding protein [Oscillospiraceae bacterium]
MKELFVEAKIEKLDSVLDFVRANMGECTPKAGNQIGIVIDEIFSNIARYAYNPTVGSVIIRVAVDDEGNEDTGNDCGGIITIEFEDSGTEYNPLSADEPDITLSADERPIGGLGIFMVKNIMDSVEYERNGNNNVLRIKKKL